MSGGFDTRTSHCYRVKLPTYAEARRILGVPDLTAEQMEARSEWLNGTGKPHGSDPVTDEGPRLNAILCGSFGPPCFHCGGVGEALCDFPFGEENRTCDRSLCLDCAPDVDADKNYCHDHDEHGRGMLLFQQPERKLTESGPAKRRAKPLPKAPPESHRWRVRQARGAASSHGAVLTGWKTQIEARLFASKVGGYVETWDDFVKLWRMLYPLASKKPRSKR